MKKTSSFLMAAVVCAALAFDTGSGQAALLAKSPDLTQGGYPVWFQDQAGMAIQGCLNDPARVPAACFLPNMPEPGAPLEPALPEQPGFDPAAPKILPENFPIEHFYFLAITGPMTLAGGQDISIEFALEGAFNPDIPATPNQEMFHRFRIIILPNTINGLTGTYRVKHPWGETLIPVGDQKEVFGNGGARGRATFDLNLGSPADNFANVLGNDPQFTISTFLTQSDPPAPVGFLGDCFTPGRVTGGVDGFNKVEIYDPNGTRIAETDLFFVCGQKVGLNVTPASAALGTLKPGVASPSTTFTITNLTGLDIPARDLDADPAEGLVFTSSNPEFSIVAGDSCGGGLPALGPDSTSSTCTFDVIYTPVAGGASSGVITIASAGNPDLTVSVTGTGDAIAPTVTLGAGQAAQFTNSTSATISGTVSDNDGGAGVASVQVAVNNGAPQPAVLTGTTWTFTATDLNLNAENTISITATDAALTDGNTSGSVAATITHDNISPLVGMTAPLAGLTANATPGLAFTATDVNLASTVVKVDGSVVQKASGNTLDQLSDGTHTITVEATDAAGNMASESRIISVDASGPVVSITSPAAGVTGKSAPLLTFEVSDANPAAINPVTILLDGVVIAKASGDALGPYTPLTQGNHTLQIDSIDELGNPSSTTVTFNVVLTDGDIDMSGAVTIADALLALRAAVNLVTLVPNTDTFYHADVAPLDQDGKPAPNGSVDITDALLILRKVVGLTTSF